MPSSQWMGRGSSRPKKARMSRSKIKMMLVVCFDWKGIVHREFVPRGPMVNKQVNQEVLARLRDAVRRKRPELWVNQSSISRRLPGLGLSTSPWYFFRTAPLNKG